MAKAIRLAIAVVVALAAVVGVLLFVQSRDKSQVDATSSSSGGPGRLLPDQGDAHTPPPPGFRFATDPPASGPHAPAAVNADARPLTRDQLLHALELGDVALVYSGYTGQLQVLRKIHGPAQPGARAPAGRRRRAPAAAVGGLPLPRDL